MEPSVQASMILESNFVYINPLIPAVSSYASIPNQNTGNEENEDTHVQEQENVDQEEMNSNNEERCIAQEKEKENEDEVEDEVAENHQENGEHLVTSQHLDMLTIQDQIQDEDRNNEEKHVTQGHQKENEDEEEDVAENHQENGEHLVTSQNLDMLTTQDQIQDEDRNNEERHVTQGHQMENEDEEEDVAENHQENGEHLVTSQNLDMLTTQDQIQDEDRNNEEKHVTQGHQKENEDEEEDVAENHQENGEHLVTSQNLDMLTTQDQIQDEDRNNEERHVTQGHQMENEDEEEDVAENHQENGEHLVTSQNLDMLTTQDQIQDELKNEVAYFKRAFDSHGTRRPSDSTGNNFEKLIVKFKEDLAFQISKDVEVNHVSQKRDKYNKIEPSVQASIILDKTCVYTHPLTPAVSSYPSIPNQNRNNEEKCITQGNEKENGDVAENHQGNGEHLVTSQNLETPTTQDQIQDEDSLAYLKKLMVDITTTSEKTVEKLDEVLKCNILYQNADRNIEVRDVTPGHQKVDEKEVEEKLQENGENLVTSQNLDMHSTMDQKQDEGSLADFKLPVDITSTSEKTVEKLEEVLKCNMLYQIAVSLADFKLPVDITSTSEKTVEKLEEVLKCNMLYQIADSLAYLKKLMVDITTTSEKTVEKLDEVLKCNILYQNADRNIEVRDVTPGHQKVDEKEVEEKLQENGENLVTSQNLDMHSTMDQKQDEDSLAYLKKLMVDITTTSEKTVEKLEEVLKCNMLYQIAVSLADFKLPVDITSTSEKTVEKLEEVLKCNMLYQIADSLAYLKKLMVDITTTSEKTVEKLDEVLKCNILYQNADRNIEVRDVTPGHQKEEEKEVEEKLQENGENLVTSQNLDMHSTMDQKQDEDSLAYLKKLMVDITTTSEKTVERLEEVLKYNTLYEIDRHKSNEASEYNANQPIHHTDICSDDSNRGMPGSMINENCCKVQDKQIPSSEANTDVSSDESLSAVESTRIRLYRNVIRNETYRMMSSTDMVMSEAEHLFGLKRSWIFFDLLAAELCHFGSAGAISEFVPNMVESTVRQNVISFFEHSWDTMNRLMTLLLRCPDSKILQQMPVQNFISLMKSVIKSSLKTKTKGREKLSLEGNIYTMVDPKEFERSLGEEIPEDVLNRLRRGDEMVVHRFVDTRLERPQPSDRRENRPILSFFLPSDCLPFIYIPTENGSYWHRLNMQRASRIHRHSR